MLKAKRNLRKHFLKLIRIAEDGELMLTLLASFAQEESRSISENIKWATRKRFEKGIPNGHKAPYGYEWDGEVFRIIPEQGEVVKEIYIRYLAGESAYIIAKTLAERGVTGQMGNLTVKLSHSNSPCHFESMEPSEPPRQERTLFGCVTENGFASE